MNVLKFGLKNYRKYLPLWLLCLFLGQIVTLCGLLLPKITQLIVDFNLGYTEGQTVSSSNPFAFLLSYGEPQTWGLFFTFCIAFVLVLLVRHILHYTRFNVSHWYGVKFENNLRDVTFRKLLSQSGYLLSRYSSGELLTTMNNDVIQFKELFTFTLPFIIDKVFLMAFAMVLLVGINPYLALAPLAVSPVLILTCVFYIKRSRVVSTNIRDRTADLSRTVQENINGVRIVRSLATEDTEIKKFDRANTSFRDAFFRHAEMWSKYGFLFNVIRICTYLASIAVGTVLAVQGKISVGDFLAFTTYVMLIMDAIMQLVNLLFQTQQFMVAGRRIYRFASANDLIANPAEPRPITGKPNFKITDLTAVMDDATVLKNINLDLPYGKKVGVMGGTGSGKSVLLKSLIRSYDPYAGYVTVNGVNVKDVDIEDLRRQFGYVFQDVFLFSNTIDANIAYYDDKAPREEVEACAKLAKAHDFILETEKGYETIVGENGIGLSGGQKQRISVARALLKHAPVLVLDSATSALDHETEKELIEGVLEACKDNTVLIATHRASSVKNMDEILYLEDGEIVERGTHDQLMALGGKYAYVYQMQCGPEEEVAE